MNDDEIRARLLVTETGRPRLKRPGFHNVHIWFKIDQFEIVSKAAETLGLNVTAFVRSAAVQAAKKSP